MEQEKSNLITSLIDMKDMADDISGLVMGCNMDEDYDSFIGSVEKINEKLERAVIKSRNTLELLRPHVQTLKPGAPTLPHINVSGEINIINYRWLHITLNTLLPHCRFQSPAYLSNTLAWLLDDYSARNRKLPFYNNAIMVIDEHCNVASRNVYVQDNKGWKAVSNALKGRVIHDDDQFNLGIALLSSKSDIPSCHIFVIDTMDVSDFFSLWFNDSLYW